MQLVLDDRGRFREVSLALKVIGALSDKIAMNILGLDKQNVLRESISCVCSVLKD